MDIFSLFFSLQGRIGRGQYWLGIVVSIGLTLFGWYLNPPLAPTHDLTMALVALVVGLVNLWLSICVAGKRYHDRNKSAWWILIVFVPIVGAIWQLIELGLLRGDEGANDYGPNPRLADDLDSLRRQSGSKLAVAAVDLPVKAAPVVAAPRPRTPYIDGRPVFGKRV